MKLKAVSFNIRCCDDKNGHSIEERAPRLAEAVKHYDADIIGLQEYRPKWEAHIEKYFGKEYEIFNKYRDDEKPESVPILWKKDRFDCLDKGYFWLSDTPEVMSKGWDDLGYNRMCEFVILRGRERGEKFTYMNTHFGFGDDCQTKSAALIAEYRAKISDLPTFVTGDFNMIPTSLGYAEMTKHFFDANTLTAKDTRATFHGYNPEKYMDEHIDYFFVSEKVKPLCREMIDKTFEDGKYPSDHFGIYMELEV